MEWLSFEGVNWIAVLVAFLVSFAFGWWYYSQWGVFKTWAKAAGVSDDVVQQGNMAVAFGGTILANLLGVILLAVFMAGLGVTGWWQGLLFGVVLGLVFRAGAHALHNGFAGRSPKVTLLDGLHDTVALGLAGLILGLMG